MKEIPQMLQILDDHTEENLDQEEWEDRLLQAFLYKFFRFTLRTSRNMKLVKMMLSSILQAIHEDLQEREGIAVALSIVSMKHLKMVLDQLQVYSAILTDKGSSFILKLTKEHQQREWGLVCNIIYLSYSKIILASKGDIFTHLDDILAVVLQHHRNCIVEKELIREEPLSSISSSIRLRAMNIISDFRKLRPLIEVEERTELLRTCRKSVLCLPPTEILQKEASSSQEAHTTVDLFRETLQSLLRLMETLTVEMPSRIQHCLEVSTSKIQLVGDLLSQSFGFLKSPQSFLRAAAINFIELTAKKLNMSQIPEDDVELLQNAIGSLRNNPVESIQALVNTTLKKIDEYVNPGSVSTSRMSQLSNNIFKVTGMKTPQRKKRLFKSVKWERDDNDDSQKEKIWKWLQSPLNSLCNRSNRRVKNAPLVVGNSEKQSIWSQVPTSESPPVEAGPAAR
ncbi:uncharacterized protein LOC118025785 [Mirounga leonina]|uniref:uncharacterized protein LOC118025785 n=1 Tax=Mirounga leonina TaxID=9715 RepID=UPI00156C3142|nr:uncharacterized protein LOC118025785 [Mirounga leonina]